MIGIGIAACFVIGMPWALSGLTLLALAALVLGTTHPVVAALAMTCLVVLDGHAADTLQSVQMGSPLAVATGGLWRYNSIGYAFLATAIVGLPSVLGRRDMHTRLAQALALVMLIGLIWSPDRWLGLQLVLDLIAFFGALFLFGRIAADRECWYWIGAVGGTLGAGAGFVYLVNLGRIPFTNPNVAVFVPLAGMIAVCLAFGAGRRTNTRDLLLGALAIVNLLWAFLSTSRGGLLTGVACLACIAFQVRSGRRRALILAGTVIIGVVVTSLFTPLQRTAVQRFSLLFDQRAGLQTRTSGRSELVLGSWDMFRRSPFGVGTGGFESTWAALGSVGGQRKFIRAGEKFAAHAGWMRVLAENGIFGFGCLAAFVASFAVAGQRTRLRTARNLGWLATVGLALSLVTSEFHMKGLLFLAAGVAALLEALPRAGLQDASPGRRGPTLVSPRKEVR